VLVLVQLFLVETKGLQIQVLFGILWVRLLLL